MKHLYTNDKAGASRVVVKHFPEQPSFIIVPPRMAKQMEKGFFKACDLADIEKLSSIVSRNDVKKFAWLNATAFAPKISGYREANKQLIEQLNTVNRFYQPEQLSSYVDAGVKEGLDTLISMLDSINPAHDLGLLEAVGFAAHQPMKMIQVKTGVFAIILYEVEVIEDDHCSMQNKHLELLSADLKASCDLINKFYPLEFMCGFSLFNEYVGIRRLMYS